MPQQLTVLSPEQQDHFLQHGYIVVNDSFSREAAEEWTSLAFRRLGYDPNDSATWVQPRIHMPTMHRAEWKSFMPKAWAAACDLVGGEERLKQPCMLGDGFIVNFNEGADRPWQSPSASLPGWHKDGDFFLHFLDSPEQALLSLIIWSDIDHKGGGTFGAGDSVAVVARYLAQHPEGLRPEQFDFRALIEQCREFVEFTGRVGDVILLHPYILHASSQNHSGKPRFLTNPALSLREPMNFNRANPEDYSLVERAVLQALGVERFDFAPTRSRERIVPERERRQQRMLEEEKARLAAASQ